MEDITLETSREILVPNVKESDTIHIVQIPTSDETLIEELLENGNLVQEYQYTERKYYNLIGEQTVKYYFWVRDKKSKPDIEDRNMSAFFVERELVKSNAPYCLFQNPLPPNTSYYKDEIINKPWRMTYFVAMGLRGLVDVNRRYVLRFTRDFTLRNSLEHSLYETESQQFNSAVEAEDPLNPGVDPPVPPAAPIPPVVDPDPFAIYIFDSFSDYNGTFLGDHISNNGQVWNSMSNVPVGASPDLGLWPQIHNNAAFPLDDYVAWAWYEAATDDVELFGTIRVPNPIWDETEVAFALRWDGALNGSDLPIGNNVAFGLRFTTNGAEGILYLSTGEVSLGDPYFSEFSAGDNIKVILRLIGNDLEITIRNLSTGYQQYEKKLVSTTVDDSGAGFYLKGNDTVVPGVDDVNITSASLPFPEIDGCFNDEFVDVDGTYLYAHKSSSGHLWNVESGNSRISKTQVQFLPQPVEYDYSLNWVSSGAATVNVADKNMSIDFFAETDLVEGESIIELIFRRETDSFKDLEGSVDPRIVFHSQNGTVSVFLKIDQHITDLTPGFVRYYESWRINAVIEDDSMVWNIVIDEANTRGSKKGFAGTYTDADIDINSGKVTLFSNEDIVGSIQIKSFEVCDLNAGSGSIISSTCKSEEIVPPNYLELKNLHEQWKLIRREQKFTIDKNLWDMITESIIKRKINNPNINVPSYEREIYDLQYGTDTRIGMGDGQAFCDSKLAKNTILSYLLDKNNDLYPIDITSFFGEYSFDNEEDTIVAMDAIYGTFPFEHVNNMFFDVLLDALTTKKEYPGIIKTSWLSLHSIIILDDQGKFDD